jgi:N-methylhydantoinase B
MSTEAMLTYRSDRHTSRPWGLAGGLPGQNSRVFITRGEEIIETTPKFTRSMRQGDVLHSVMQSGGGWGNPLDRDLADVLEDVLDEKVDRKRARAVYGVVINVDAQEVDADETRVLRAEMRNSANRTQR